MKFEQAVGYLDEIIFNCTTPDWDIHDPDNWASTVLLLEEIKAYITLEHVRKTV